MSIKAFIFDLDGVITDTAEYHFQAWQHLAHSLDITFEREHNEMLKGLERMASLDAILARGNRTFSDEERQQLADRKNRAYLALVNTITPADLLPGVMPLLDELARRGYRIGLASASKNAALVLKRLGITERFDYVADANLIRRPKPDPEVFLDVMTSFGLTPAECIGVEDAAMGIDAIKDGGMFAVGIGDANVLKRGDLVFESMTGFDLEGVLAAARTGS